MLFRSKGRGHLASGLLQKADHITYQSLDSSTLSILRSREHGFFSSQGSMLGDSVKLPDTFEMKQTPQDHIKMCWWVHPCASLVTFEAFNASMPWPRCHCVPQSSSLAPSPKAGTLWFAKVTSELRMLIKLDYLNLFCPNQVELSHRMLSWKVMCFLSSFWL